MNALRAAAGRRRIALVAAISAVLAIVGVTVATSSDDCALDPRSLAPTCGLLWGAALDVPGSRLTTAVPGWEAASGRRLDVVHTYHRWDDVFPTAAEKQVAYGGRLLFLNWEPVRQDDGLVSWSAIAAGEEDATIRAGVRRLAALERPLLVSFAHEPELRYPDHGEAPDFAAAYRHVVDLARQEGADEVRWVWNMMGLTDATWRARYPELWPGPGYVDWIAWDPYNFASCRDEPWETFAEIVRPFYRWLQTQDFARDTPYMLAEFGTIEGSEQGKAGWIRRIPAALAEFPRLRALTWFDYPSPPATCDWLLATSSAAQQAYREVAAARPFRWTATVDLDP